jgi:hypothetical protein
VSAGRHLLAVSAVSVALLAGGGDAAAEDDSSVPDSPSIAQYIEDVPTAAGASPAAPGGESGEGALPARVRERIASEGGEDAAQLEQLATSPGFGAPRRSPARGGSTPAAGSPGSLAAAASALEDQDSGELGRILVLMLAITIAGVAAAAVGLRRRL